MAGEGEGVLIPIEARDEFSSAVSRMQEAADKLAESLKMVNENMKDLGDESDKQERKMEGGGFFGKLQEGYEKINSFKVGNLMHELEDTSVAGLAVGASMVAGTEKAMEMEEQITRLSFASKVTKEQIDDLTRASYEMAEGSKFAATDFQSVGSRLLKAGADMKATNEVMESTKELTTAFGGNFVNNYMKTEQAAKAFGLEMKQIPEVMNTVAKVAGETNLSVDELLAPMQRLAPSAKAVGLTFEDTAGLLASFNKAGLSGRFAMQALMQSMQQATKHGVDYQTYMRSVGADYEKMNSQTAKSALLVAALGQKGAMLSQVFKQTGGDISKMTEQFKNAAGTLSADAEKAEGDTGDRMASLKNHFANASAEVANKYLPMLNGVMGLLTKIPSEAIVGGTAAAQGIGIMGKGIEIASHAAIAFKLLNLGTYMTNLGVASKLASVGMAGMWGVAIAGAAALGYGIGTLINKLMEMSSTFKAFVDYTAMLPVTMAEKAVDWGSNQAGRRASSIGGAERADAALVRMAGSDKGAAASAYKVLRIETTGTNTEREQFIKTVAEAQAAGVHIDNVHFNVTKDTKAEDVEKMLRDLITRGRKTVPSGAGKPTR